MLNAFTVDLEDWGQAVLDPKHPVTERVVANTRRLLDLLDHWGVRGTFFALGSVCERYPELLPGIDAAGHEIGSHGFSHGLVDRQTPERFRDDLQRSVAVIRSQVGYAPSGYRAPAFSISRRTRWAAGVLEEEGFRYSSSVFPFAGRRYGIPDAPPGIHRWEGLRLLEAPLTTLRILGRAVPCCGGGYTRLLPLPLLAAAVKRVNRAGRPAVLYVHPYELAPGETRAFPAAGFRCTWSRRLTQELWRSRVEPRLTGLFRRFRFATMSDVLELQSPGDEAEITRQSAPAMAY